MSKLNQFIFLLIILYCFAASPILAQQQQTSSEKRLTAKFGIKGGVNFSNLYDGSVQNQNLKIGVNVGLFAKLPIVRGISIQPELLYSSQGAKNKYGSSVVGSGEYNFNLNYVQAPLLMVFNLTKNLSLSGGAYAAYLISANVKDVNNSNTITGATNLNTNNFYRYDYGLVGGLSIDIQNVTLGARYNYGLQNVGRAGSLSGDLTSNSKNSVATFFIGFAL